VSLRDAWEAEARNWVAWARTPGHDSYWQFHRDRFLQLLPPPKGLTLDIGCGEATSVAHPCELLTGLA